MDSNLVSALLHLKAAFERFNQGLRPQYRQAQQRTRICHRPCDLGDSKCQPTAALPSGGRSSPCDASCALLGNRGDRIGSSAQPGILQACRGSHMVHTAVANELPNPRLAVRCHEMDCLASDCRHPRTLIAAIHEASWTLPGTIAPPASRVGLRHLAHVSTWRAGGDPGNQEDQHCPSPGQAWVDERCTPESMRHHLETR